MCCPFAVLLALSFFGLVFLSVVSRAAGQAAGVNQAGPGYIHGNVTNDTAPQHSSGSDAAKLEQMRKAEMHRRVLADAGKLAQLSAELKVELDGTPGDQLSLGAIRKAAEIEKLARSVKDGLKY